MNAGGRALKFLIPGNPGNPGRAQKTIRGCGGSPKNNRGTRGSTKNKTGESGEAQQTTLEHYFSYIPNVWVPRRTNNTTIESPIESQQFISAST